MILEELVSKLYDIPYVEGGRDTSGADCWGLCLICLEEYFGVQVEAFQGISYNDGFMDNNTKVAEWIAAHMGDIFYQAEQPQVGDVILLNVCGLPIHMGFVIDEGLMVHTARGHGVAVEKFLGTKWKNKIVGYYRLK